MTMGRQHCSQIARLIALRGTLRSHTWQFVLVLQGTASSMALGITRGERC